MKKILPFLLLAFLSCNLKGQNKVIELIVRGDDIGFSHSANEACIDAYRNGIMTSVEIMVPGPWFPQAVKLLNDNPGLDVGIHLVLTSEWETLKWRPLTHVPSLTDQDGYFYPMIWPGEHFGAGKNLKSADWKLSEIEQELRAQIEMAKAKIPQVSHLSAHMGFTGLAPEVKEMVQKLAVEYELDIDPDDFEVKRATYQGPKETPREKVNSFIAMLESLQPGKYLFVDHPGTDAAEMKAVYHIGYETVAADRVGVTMMMKDPAVKAAIKKHNIRLISYSDLKKPH